jgi:diguanylate cyclase (GGDEF)-like protein/PAS domain S-box-containing protein
MMAAAALFAAVTALRFVSGDRPGEGITLLYVVPIALLALDFGPRGGLIGGLIGVGLVLFWALVENVDVPAIGYATRTVSFVVVGLGVGLLSERRKAADAETARWWDMSNDLLCEASFDGYLTRVNDAWELTLGYTRAQLMARPYIELIHPDDVKSGIDAVEGLAASPSDLVNFECRVRASDGSWRWLLWGARSDEERIYAVAKDITDRKGLEAEREQLLARVEAMAKTDELTGVANRRAWDEELRRELDRAERYGYSVSIALLDLDRFKLFNDERGHAAGDDFLREAAMSWRLAGRATDFIARYGGEEFGVILPSCSLDVAEVVVDQLRRATPMGQTCSAGIAQWDGAESPEALVARADAALYEAKRDGRDRLAVSAA